MKSPRLSRPFRIFMIVFIILLVLTIVLFWQAVDRLYSFDELLEKLERQEIVQGDSTRDLYGLGLTIAQVVHEDADGSEYLLLAYSYDRETLHVYAKDDLIYGAQLVGGSWNTERWFFCDQELLARHVRLSIEAAAAGHD